MNIVSNHDGASGYLSSESSFYGESDSEDVKHEDSLDIKFYDAVYWKYHPHLLPVIAAASRAASKTPSTSEALYNPYEGRTYARQLNESVEDFLQRLPPRTTAASFECPWIFVSNPHRTPSIDRDVAAFVSSAQRLLADLTKQSKEIEVSMKGKAQGIITKKLIPLRTAAKEKLLACAKEYQHTSGKWMLFPYPDDVNACWATVAHATVNRELGIAAKVAPDAGEGDRGQRLICIYTKDFSDLDDVKRVLERLAELGMVKKGRDIYYKADALTELNINSGNEWGLKPSLYASKDLLGGPKK
ncbi:MAG: hypothetical protein Q9174_003841 [Haloplaca sp. 1 TL-2023]